MISAEVLAQLDQVHKWISVGEQNMTMVRSLGKRLYQRVTEASSMQHFGASSDAEK